MNAPSGAAQITSLLTSAGRSLSADTGITPTQRRFKQNPWNDIKKETGKYVENTYQSEPATVDNASTLIKYYDPNTNYAGLELYRTPEITAVNQPVRDALIGKGLYEGTVLGLASRNDTVQSMKDEVIDLRQRLGEYDRVLREKEKLIDKQTDLIQLHDRQKLEYEARARTLEPLAQRPQTVIQHQDNRQGVLESLRTFTGSDTAGKVAIGVAGLSILFPIVMAFFKSP